MNKYTKILAIILIVLIVGQPAVAPPSYQEDLKGKNLVDVIQYWLNEDPHSPRGSYELMIYTDQFTSRGYKKDTVSGEYKDLRIWVDKHKTETKLIRNNMVVINQ